MHRYSNTKRLWPGSVGLLSGIAGSLSPRGSAAEHPGWSGPYLHGLAAPIAARGAPLTAAEVAEAVPAAIRALSGEDPPRPRA